MSDNPFSAVLLAAKKLLEQKKIKISITITAAVLFITIITVPSLPKASNEKQENDAIQYLHTEAFTDENNDTELKLEQGFALFVDGEFIAVAEDKETVDTVVEKVATVTAAYFGAGADAALSSSVTVTEGEFEHTSVKNEEQLLECLGVDDDAIIPDSIKLKVSYSIPQTEEVASPYETLYYETQFLAKGIEKKMQDGEEGIKKVDYEVLYENGVEVAKKVLAEQVVVSHKPEIIERGIGRGIATSTSNKVFSLPYLGRISSGFGWRLLYGAPDLHDGLDLVHPAYANSCYGDSVKAAGEGVVVVASPSGGYGNYVVIQHANGIRTGYAHLSFIGVKVGQQINTGDFVGKIGNTGKSTGSHLHFEVIIDGHKVDPIQFLKDTDLLG